MLKEGNIKWFFIDTSIYNNEPNIIYADKLKEVKQTQEETGSVSEES